MLGNILQEVTRELQILQPLLYYPAASKMRKVSEQALLLVLKEAPSLYSSLTRLSSKLQLQSEQK